MLREHKEAGTEIRKAARSASTMGARPEPRGGMPPNSSIQLLSSMQETEKSAWTAAQLGSTTDRK